MRLSHPGVFLTDFYSNRAGRCQGSIRLCKFVVPTDFPLHLIHCLCKGLEQEVEPAALFFAIVLLKRIAQRIQIVEFFSHIQKIFRYVRRVLTRVAAAVENNLAVIREFLFEVRLEDRERTGIVLDGQIDILSLFPVEGCKLIMELRKVFRTDTGDDLGDLFISRSGQCIGSTLPGFIRNIPACIIFSALAVLSTGSF